MLTLDEIKKRIAIDSARVHKVAIQAAYVKGDNPSILAPVPKEEPDNRIPVPFARRAINMVTGYLAKEGNIVYSGDGYDNALKEALDANDEGLVDLELMTTALAHGTAFELHWAEGGKDQFAQIPISQCIAIYDDALRPNMVGFIRYWRETDVVTNQTIYYAHVYDDKYLQKYIGKSIDHLAEDGAAISHGYGRVPIVEFNVSADKSNIFDHVTALIDFYDKIMSEDFANELARFASSYMLMAGQVSDAIDPDTGETEIDKIKRTLLFQNLSGEKSVLDQIAFLTKNINADFIEKGADRCERLIYEMLQLFNPNDDTFVQASGVAQKYKLLGFEYLCTAITTYFSIGLQDRIALIKKLESNLSAQTLAGKIKNFFGLARKNTDVTITFNRNLPDDIEKLALIVSQLKDILSDETLLKLFPSYVVPDVDEELRRVDEQKQANIDLFGPENNNTDASADNGGNNENGQ